MSRSRSSSNSNRKQQEQEQLSEVEKAMQHSGLVKLTGQLEQIVLKSLKARPWPGGGGGKVAVDDEAHEELQIGWRAGCWAAPTGRAPGCTPSNFAPEHTHTCPISLPRSLRKISGRSCKLIVICRGLTRRVPRG